MIRIRLAGGPGLLWLDVLVLAWALAWTGAGIVVSHEVRGLSELSDTAAQTGRAAIAVGDAVRGLPLVGERVREAGDEVRAAGAEAVGSARSARASARRVGDLLGAAIAAIPTLPILLLYIPARIAATRERRDLRHALATCSRDELDQLLALRAAARLPLRRLMEVSDNPARDLGDGLHRKLAEAELRRHQVPESRARATDSPPRARDGESMRRSRYGRVVVALRWPIALAWIAAALFATAFLPTIEESQNGALGDLVPNDAEAIDAEVRSSELFGFPLLSRTIVVQRDPRGLDPGVQAATLNRSVAINRDTLPDVARIGGAIPVLNTVFVPGFTRERGTTAVTYLYFTPDVGIGRRAKLAERVRERAERVAPGTFTGVTGAIPARKAQAALIADRLPLVELATVLLVIAAIGLHYRALLAPAVTLAAIAISYLLTVRLVASLGLRLGVAVPSEVQPVMVVLIFGLVTDYAIFFISRFRLRLGQGHPARPAAESAAGEIAGTVVAAGLSVAAASAALVAAQLGFLETFGPGLALAVLLALLVAVTFIPAALAITGDRVFWPSRPGRDVPAGHAREEITDPGHSRPVRSRALRIVIRHPMVTAVACAAILLGAASGLFRLDVGQTLIRGLPPENEVNVAYRQAAAGFVPGVLSPTVVVVERGSIVDRRAELRELQGRLATLPGVALVVGPREQPLQGELGAVYSRTRDAVRFLVVFEDDPLGAGAIGSLRTLRERLPALADTSGLPTARASIAGDTALAEETVRLTEEDLGRVAPWAIGAVFLILAVFLRALVAPLYLVGASVLALAATLGLTVYVFQDLLGHGELTFFVPIVAAVTLMALGSDYNVFLAGRIWQEARRRPFREAIAVGGSRAASAITVAGVVLALSFALLALVPIRAFRELAFAMSVGLLIDAFLVRTLLAPALMALVGPRAGWPGTRLSARGRAATPPPRAPEAPMPLPGPTSGAPASRALRVIAWLAVASGVLSRMRRH